MNADSDSYSGRRPLVAGDRKSNSTNQNNSSGGDTFFTQSQFLRQSSSSMLPSSATRADSTSFSSTSSFYRRFRIRHVWNCVSCKELSVRQYRILLFATLFFNLLMVAVEVLRLKKILDDKSDFSHITDSSDHNADGVAALLSLVATILTAVNCLFIGYLMYRPTPRIAVVAIGFTLVLEVIYIIQTVLYFEDFATQRTFMVVTIAFLVIQLITAWLLYRLWEFAFFNYDDGGSAGLRNLVDEYNTGGLFSSQDLEEPMIVSNVLPNSQSGNGRNSTSSSGNISIHSYPDVVKTRK